jgi:hypothetical protein
MEPKYGASTTSVADMKLSYGAGGEGTLVPFNMNKGRGIIVTGGYLAGDGTLIATGGLIVQLTLTGGAIVGSGTMTGSAIAGVAQLTATLVGDGVLIPVIGAKAGMTVTLTGDGTIDAATILTAIGHMSATIYVNTGDAQVAELVSGVWEAAAVDHDVSGTMGEKLNAAGTAGDPWTTDLTPYNTADTAGKLMKQAGKALTTGKFIALK